MNTQVTSATVRAAQRPSDGAAKRWNRYLARLPQPVVCGLPAAVLATCLLVPFLPKAYTIDDTLFLRQAQHALHDPLHPSAFVYQWNGTDSPMRLSHAMPSGPVMAYLLIPSVLLRNGEAIGHAIQLLFLIAAAFAIAAIALRLGYAKREAAMAALLLVSSPVVVGMTATCMPDTVAMSLGAVGIACALAWREDRRWAAAAAAAVALTLSVAARPHCAALLLPAFVLVTSHRENRPAEPLLRRVMGPIPILAVPLLAWGCTAITRDPVTGDGITASIVALGNADWYEKVFALLVAYTLTVPFGLGIFLGRLRAGRAMPVLAIAVPAGVAAARLIPGWPDAFTAAAAALTFAALLLAFAPPRPNDRLALASWLLVPLPVVFYVHFAAKYLLASVPAAALLVVRELRGRHAVLARATACVLIVAGAAMGLLIARADARMSGLGREAARRIVSPAVQSGVPVWFAGHWGFQWYMEQAGAKPILPNTKPAHGDLVVVSLATSGRRLARGCAGCALIDWLGERAPGGRIMAGGAGFYSHASGWYPWVWSAATDEEIDVYRAP